MCPWLSVKGEGRAYYNIWRKIFQKNNLVIKNK